MKKYGEDEMPVRNFLRYLMLWAAIILLWVVAAVIGAFDKER